MAALNLLIESKKLLNKACSKKDGTHSFLDKTIDANSKQRQHEISTPTRHHHQSPIMTLQPHRPNDPYAQSHNNRKDISRR